jgi:segregation and condensation protein B
MFGLGKTSKEKKEAYVAPVVDLTLDQQIETLLFMRGNEVGYGELAKVFGLKKKEIVEEVDKLVQRLDSGDSALQIVRNEDDIVLTTRAEAAPLIESLQKTEVEGALSPAALETLTIILYKTPVNRAEIDYIRGVNSIHSLRNLMMRGLVQRKGAGMNITYVPSNDALRFFGITNMEDLPDYAELQKKLSDIAQQTQAEQAKDAQDQPAASQ